jgi:5-methylcytosine-specific restriction endonuclease McrA
MSCTVYKLEMKENILKLKKEYPKWGYRKLAKELNLKVGIVRYHLDPQAKEKTRLRKQKSRKNLNQILKRKKDNFQCVEGWRRSPNAITRGRAKSLFTAEELKEKITTNPICYLTGRPINLLEPKTYQLDHIVPVAKGGKNELANCGLTCKEANMAKGEMTLEEFLKLCEEVLKNFGRLGGEQR